HALQLYRAVLEATQHAVSSRTVDLKLLQQPIELPARDEDGRRVPVPLETGVAALRIGDAAFVLLPGEPFVETGLAIREQSPFLRALAAGGAGAYIGYIPTDKAFVDGGYETGPGRWSRLMPGSEPLLRETCVNLITRAAECGAELAVAEPVETGTAAD